MDRRGAGDRRYRAVRTTLSELGPGRVETSISVAMSGYVAPVKLFRLLDHVRTSLWFVPTVCVVAGVALSLFTVAVDRSNDYKLIPQSFTGGPDIAIAILSAVATSMVSLAALVLTITMVVVQLAMGQFSPRIVQTFLQDKPSQIAVGLFVATFAHAVVALREVNVDEGVVPGLAIVVAFVLVLASIVVLVLYVHHIGRSLRVASLLELVSGKTRKLLDQVYPDRGEEPEDGSGGTVAATKSGVVNHIGHDALIDAARRARCALELVPALGEFVPAGAPLFRVHGEPTDLDEDAVTEAVVLGLERTLDQDVAYGFRMLVDIAERSLADSPFLDPTTAVQAIDRLHDCLRQMARRPLPDGHHRDEDGEVRLTLAVRVLGCDGSGEYAGVIAGVDWVTGDAGKKSIANMSLGGGPFQALDDAVTASIESGVPYSLSAGNSYDDACNYTPGRTPKAITVGATDEFDDEAWFSNYGSCVDIYAPGDFITSAWYTSDSATNTISGTSMAAPHVAGVAALYNQLYPGAGAIKIRNQVVQQSSKNKINFWFSVGSPNKLLYSRVS